jgi:polysaccharide export outer membrane protein
MSMHRFVNKVLPVLFLLGLAPWLGGCASNDTRGPEAVTLAEFQSQYSGGGSFDVDGTNQQLLSMAVQSGSDGIYRLGPGDEVRIDVFGVEELTGDYRIDGSGRASLPLIGQIEISGYTLSEAKTVLERRYGERYRRNPQITISVLDYRSQQFTAVGAVGQARIYSVDREVSLLEALAMAGGLSTNAGENIYLTDRVRDPETGEMVTRNLLINIAELMRSDTDYNVVIGEDAVINVPTAGSIFVEGAVQKPGVYTARGETTVLKAITMAGGLKFEADRSSLRVLKQDPETRQWIQQVVAFDEIRESPLADVRLNDGDIVMVERGAIRTAWVGAWETVSRLVFLGFRPLTP